MTWDVHSDPRLIRESKKNGILVMLMLCGAIPGFTGSIYFPDIPVITQSFNTPAIMTILTAAVYMFVMAVSPIIWAALSDHYQVRRIILLAAIVLYTVASVGCALMTSIGGLVALRCVQGMGACASHAIGPAVLADIYRIEQRGKAFSRFYFGVFFGPMLGPVLGGFLTMSALSWRATFWFCAAFGTMSAGLLWCFMPETFRGDRFGDNPHASKQQQQQQEEVSPTPSHAAPPPPPSSPPNSKMNPVAPFLMLRHPHILLASLVTSVMFGTMMAMQIILPQTFSQLYHFTTWQTGLCFLGGGLGNITGALINGHVSDKLLLRARARRKDGQPRAEDRITINMWPSGLVLIPIGQMLFGWTLSNNPSWPFYIAIIGYFIQNSGLQQINTSISAYIVDAVPPGKGASASAAANFVRMIMAGVLMMVTDPMLSTVGPGYTCVFLLGIIMIGMVILLSLLLFGERLRRYAGFEQQLNSSIRSGVDP